MNVRSDQQFNLHSILLFIKSEAVAPTERAGGTKEVRSMSVGHL